LKQTSAGAPAGDWRAGGAEEAPPAANAPTAPLRFPKTKNYVLESTCTAPPCMLAFDIETTGLDRERCQVTVVCTEDFHTGEKHAYEFGRALQGGEEAQLHALKEQLPDGLRGARVGECTRANPGGLRIDDDDVFYLFHVQRGLSVAACQARSYFYFRVWSGPVLPGFGPPSRYTLLTLLALLMLLTLPALLIKQTVMLLRQDLVQVLLYKCGYKRLGLKGDG
jgi:hypothetical protein